MSELKSDIIYYNLQNYLDLTGVYRFIVTGYSNSIFSSLWLIPIRIFLFIEVDEKRAGILNEIRTSDFPPNEPFHSLVAPAHSKVTDNSSNLSLDVFTSFTSV